MGSDSIDILENQWGQTRLIFHREYQSVKILGQADQARYHAKRHDRNLVCCYEDLMASGALPAATVAQDARCDLLAIDPTQGQTRQVSMESDSIDTSPRSSVGSDQRGQTRLIFHRDHQSVEILDQTDQARYQARYHARYHAKRHGQNLAYCYEDLMASGELPAATVAQGAR